MLNLCDYENKNLSLCQLQEFLIFLINSSPVCNKFTKSSFVHNQSFVSIPIIFLSGKDSSSDIEQAYESGGIDYVVKPFITIELITKVNSYVKLKRLEDKLEALGVDINE